MLMRDNCVEIRFGRVAIFDCPNEVIQTLESFSLSDPPNFAASSDDRKTASDSS